MASSRAHTTASGTTTHPQLGERMTNVEQSASGSEADLRPLPENVEGHAMGRFHMHPDGRFCMYHHRLGAWTPDHLNECTREHDEQPKQRA